MRPSGIGGQAVIEGVMMKNKDEYAVAVRTPDNEIVVDKKTYKGIASKGIFKIPFLRGVASFFDSMILGLRIISYSASFFEDEEPEDTKKKKKKDKKNEANEEINAEESEAKDIEAEAFEKDTEEVKEEKEEDKKGEEKKENTGVTALLMGFAVVLSLGLSIVLFFILPFFLSQLVASKVESSFLQGVIEGAIRLTIFILYILGASQMKDIKRMFMYHGAEHKAINCIENGFELTVENVKWQSKQHKRCGTSFMLYVMLISILIFSVIRVKTMWLRVVFRLLLLPVIAGISYEFIRLAGKSNSKVMSILSKPGLMMQGLSTKEPDDTMIEVAIRAVEEVFDWKAFLAEKEKQPKKRKANSKTRVEEVTAATKEVVNDEDDEILAALDKYFVADDKESK